MFQNIFDLYFEFAEIFFESGSAGYYTPQNKKHFQDKGLFMHGWACLGYMQTFSKSVPLKRIASS
jgi:hypothetical protein